MVRDGDPSFPEVTTADKFAGGVAKIVWSAVENGVDVRGSWLVGRIMGSYDVRVVAVVPRRESRDGSPAAGVVEAVVARDGVDPADLPPLASAVDPDALDAVIDEDDEQRRLSFEYHGYAVTVHADGSVLLGE
jgi:hypothetical protein